MTVVHRKGLSLDGGHPALMSVYGAYGQCLETGFEPERLALLDRGWVIALAHVRGGGELGRRYAAFWCQHSKQQHGQLEFSTAYSTQVLPVELSSCMHELHCLGCNYF